jgi:hypothetical protein
MTPEEGVRRQAARQIDLDSWRRGHPDAEPLPSPEAVLEDQARNRSRLDPAFGAAWSLLVAGFKPLPLNAAGRPLPGAKPVGDTATLMSTWDRHPHAVAGAACGPEYDLVAVAFTDDGLAWLSEVSVDPATRRRPVAAKPEPVSVPFGGYKEPNDPRPGAWHREPFGIPVRLIEALPPGPRMPVAVSAPGARDRSMTEDLGRKLRRPKPMTSTIMCWAWPLPEGDRMWSLPVGRRVRAGVELAAAIPADHAELEVDGKRWRVSWGSGLARRLPMPSWLAAELGKLRAP